MKNLNTFILFLKFLLAVFAATEAKKHEANKARKFCFYIYWLNTKYY